MASLIQRNGTYYITDRLSGKIIRHSLRTDNMQVAKEKLRQFNSAHFRDDQNPLRTPHTHAPVVGEYVRHIYLLKTGKSAQTDICYLRDSCVIILR